MDIEDDFDQHFSSKNDQNQQNERHFMVNMLFQLLEIQKGNEKTTNYFNNQDYQSTQIEEKQMNNLLEQYGLVQENMKHQKQIQRLIDQQQQQQSYNHKYNQDNLEKRKSQNGGVFEMIFLRHSLREQQLKEIQSERNSAKYTAPTLDHMEHEKKYGNSECNSSGNPFDNQQSSIIQNFNCENDFDEEDQEEDSKFGEFNFNENNAHFNFNTNHSQISDHKIASSSSRNFPQQAYKQIEQQTIKPTIQSSRISANQFQHQHQIPNSTNFQGNLNNNSMINHTIIDNQGNQYESPTQNKVFELIKSLEQQIVQNRWTIKDQSEIDMIQNEQLQQSYPSGMNINQIEQNNLQSKKNKILAFNAQIQSDKSKQNTLLGLGAVKNSTNKDQKESKATNQQQLSAVQQIQKNIKCDKKILVCCGMVIFDGALRAQGMLHVSFGYQLEIVVQVEERKRLNTISVKMMPDEKVIIPSVSDTYNFMDTHLGLKADLSSIKSKIPPNSRSVFQLKEVPDSLKIIKSRILNHRQSRENLEALMSSFVIEQDLLKWKDDDFQPFLNECFKFLENYDTNQTSMYMYTIATANHFVDEVQMHEIGYSKPYLNLLGIDSQSFNSLMMRGQKIDLMRDKEMIHQQTLYAMLQCFSNIYEIEIYTDIVTFDGFPLTLYQKQRKIVLPFKQKSAQYEYIFFITEVDVDIKDLKELINYRQNISQKNKKLSYDDYLRKELSYLFEEVEYSVHSQSFLEKYYQENLEKLRDQKDLRESKQGKPMQSSEELSSQFNNLKPVQYQYLPV